MGILQGALEDRLGVWIFGALGDVASTAVVGAFALAREQMASTGLVTALPEFSTLPLASPGGLIFGGHELRDGDWPGAAAQLEAELGCFGGKLLEAVQADLQEASANIRPGWARGVSEQLEGRRAGPTESAALALERLRADLREFRERHGLSRVVAVHLTSTEPVGAESPALASWPLLEAAIQADEPGLPASLIYALAALEEGIPVINFTPCLGSSAPALIERAEELGVCHAGRDGKTGETLLRTVLAPMFLARNLRVLSWSGFNVLGNRDGRVLSDPAANRAKTQSKDAVLRSILGDHLDESLTRIDFVASLKDFKTAWDLIHFEGFLGTRMSLQFTWQGADSALAAPLVLDLVRLIDLCQRAGRRGVVAELASFFKNPQGFDSQVFSEQMQALYGLLAELRQSLSVRQT